MPDYDLDEAYELTSPGDNRDHYAGWAGTYDAEFAEAWGYQAPRLIAETYLAEGGDAPVLDLGAGTGLVAEHLAGTEAVALDITPEMLALAEAKGLYARLVEADATLPLPFADGAFGGVISCGTFTHGHVGPGVFPELIRVTRPGGLFVCGTKAEVMDAEGFGAALARLVAHGAIAPVRWREIPIYAEGARHDHAGDVGLVMIFRTAGGA